MKKLAKYMLVAAAALAAFACNKEAGIEAPSTKTGTIVFTATLDDAVKATLNEYKVCWDEGDQIAVNNGTSWAVSSALSDADIEADGRTATFAVDIAAAASYTLVYPASAVSDATLPTDAPAGSIMLSLPARQEIPAGKCVDPAALVQIASSTEPTKVSFKNATSLVEFKAPESGISAVGIEAFSASGSAIKIIGNAPVLAEPAAVAGSAPKLTVKADFAAGQSYFAVVWPQENVGSILFCFSKGSAKAGRLGTSAAGFQLPVSGGKKFEDFGTLSWLETISSKADLDRWAQISDFYEEGETVALGADIDYEGGTWTPVNGNAISDHFAGVFDGAGHSIYNIVIEGNGQFPGFFSTLASENKILRVKDLTLGRSGDASTCLITGTAVENAGVLSGRIKNTIIQNITNNVPVVFEATPASGTPVFGGITGRSMENCDIIGCTNNAPVVCNNNIAATYFGGIVGTIYDRTNIESCTNNGRVARDVQAASGKVNCFGGIIGRTGNTTDRCFIKDCINTGTIETTVNVKASQMYFGGIGGMDGSVPDGSSETNLYVGFCTNSGEINGFNQSTASYVAAGGIMGRLSNYSMVEFCNNLGSVTKTGNHSIEGCYGGILGMVSSADAIVKECVNGASDDDTKGIVTDAVQTTSKNLRIGGIVGFAQRGNIEFCTNYALVHSTSTQTKVYVGGIAGNSTIGLIKGCACYGDVIVENEATDTRTAGGIIGLQNGSSSEVATGEGCIVKCNVSSGVPGDAGLVVGRFSNSVPAVWGSSSEPVVIMAGCTLNGAAATSGNFESMLAGSSYGITASGVASGNNTIWAKFQ